MYNNSEQKTINNIVDCDFANLNNLYCELEKAMKIHQSNRYKLARNSSV